MRDIAPSLSTGLAGAVLVDGMTLIQRMFGVRTKTPWGVAAEIFLRPEAARTSSYAPRISSINP